MESPPDLHTLLGQFAALRHEVHLQTKAVRAQQEQNAEALRVLGDAVESLQEAPQDSAEEDLQRPLLKALVEIHDALALAEREVGRGQTKVLPLLEQLAAEPSINGSPAPEQTETPRLPWWARAMGLDATVSLAQRQQAALAEARGVALEQLQTRQRQAAAAATEGRQLVDAVLTGYRMSLQRLERALQQHGLEAIACLGERFDPERMEVIEAVADSAHPAGEVIQEVRRGYLWNGRLFRYAQVRVAR